MTEQKKQLALLKIDAKEVQLKRDEAYRYFVPNGKQEEVLYLNNFIRMFLGGNGTGKCKKLTSPVLMANGEWKELGKIIAGDKVIGVNYETGIAEPTNVVATSKAGIKKVYRVNFNDGGFVEASEEHSFPVRYRSGKEYITHGIKKHTKNQKKTLREIIDRGNKLSISKKTRFIQAREVNFNSKDLILDPYLLGALLGDGSMTEKHQLGITNKDIPIINRVRKSVRTYGCDLHQIYEIGYNIVGDGVKNCILNKIRELGLYGCNSKTKFIPDVYKTASVEDRKQLLAGLVDTDGAFTEYTSISKQLADDFAFVVRSLGGKATVNYKKTHCVYKGKDVYDDAWRVYWKLNFNLPLELGYKQKHSKKPVDYTSRIVKNIKCIGEYECGDIQVEHSHHCYISDDWVITGNTAVEANIIANICAKDNRDMTSWFRDIPYFKNLKRPTRGRIISSATIASEVVIPELEKWLPMKNVTRNKEFKPYFKKWKINGHEFDILTTEQDPKEHEGVTLDWVIFDEPPTKQVFDVYPSRFRSKNEGVIFMFMTPLTDAGWIYDDIFNKQKERDVGVIYSTCWDASKSKGVRGHLSDVFINRLIEQYKDTPEELDARLEGKFMHLAGLVFKNFRRDKHVIKPFTIPTWWNIIEAIDTHPQTPDAVMWLAIDELGYKYIIDELWFDGTVEEEAMAIIAKRKQIGVDPIVTIVEPAAWNVDKHTNINVADMLAEELARRSAKFSFEKGSKDLMGGIEAIRNAFKPDKAEVPMLRIFENCTRTVWEIERWVWQKFSGKSSDKKDPPNRPVDKDDHFVECCLDENTIVHCKNGDYKIKDLVGKTGEVLTPIGFQKFYDVRKTQENVDIYRVELEDGRYVDATKDHEIMSWLGHKWTRIKDLKVGDYLFDNGQCLLSSEKREAKIKKISKIGVANVYNMEVDIIHCFTVNGGIVVHNCRRILLYNPQRSQKPISDFERQVREAQRFNPNSAYGS